MKEKRDIFQLSRDILDVILTFMECKLRILTCVFFWYFDLISGKQFVDASFWLSNLVRQTRSGYVRRIRIKIGIN